MVKRPLKLWFTRQQAATVCLLAFLLLCASAIETVNADTLGDAYAKEFTFLKAQKEELEARLDRERGARASDEREARAEVAALQTRFIELTTEVDLQRQKIEQLQSESTDRSSAQQLIDNVESQITSTLGEVSRAPTSTLPLEQRLAAAFDTADDLTDEWSALRAQQGVFYLSDGTRTEGQLVRVGNIASYAVGQNEAGALVPSGGGSLRLWEQGGSFEDAVALAQGERPTSLSIFIYENEQIAVSPPEEKSIEDVVESGGIIGYIILGLGAMGLLLAVFRILVLLFAGQNPLRTVERATLAFRRNDYDKATSLLRRTRGAAGRVLADIAGHAGQGREQLEDIISQSILRENTRLDRFGLMILVIAAVAPLLGLLGTVSGMIDTFDVITEFGTGDPKLLAGGISVALVTTMLGLSVAIPLVLLGNLLSGWATRIKDRMERSAMLCANAIAIYHHND